MNLNHTPFGFHRTGKVVYEKHKKLFSRSYCLKIIEIYMVLPDFMDGGFYISYIFEKRYVNKKK